MTFKGAMLSVKRMSKTEWDVFHRRYCPYQVFLEKKSPCEQMKGNCKECWSREMPDEKAVSPNGYKDGFAYNEGLKDAWEFAKRIMHMTMEERAEVFNENAYYKVLDEFKPQEALAKLKEYEDSKIEVGDVVTEGNRTFIVTHISCDCVFGLLPDGDLYSVPKISDCKKTGKHIDIKAILEQIGE